MSTELENVITVTSRSDVGDKYPLNLVTEMDAQQFWEKYQLPIELNVLIRGFLAFRHRAYIETKFSRLDTIPDRLVVGEHEYTKLELEALWNHSKRGRWETLRNISRLHRLLIVACVFAAMTQGWDQAAMAGAGSHVMEALGRPVAETAQRDQPDAKAVDNVSVNQNTWLLGLLVGAPFLFGAPIGLLITDRLTEIWQFGRRGAICAASVFSFISVIGSASVHDFSSFLAFRILLGAGMAGKASIVPILLSETAPRNIRGLLLVFWQLSVAFGLAAGSVANLSLYHLNEEQSWRYMFISAFIPALLLFSLVLFSPESPRWLLKKSGLRENATGKDRHTSKARVQQALKSLIELHNEPTQLLAAGELILLYKRLVQEQKHFPTYFDATESASPLYTPIAHVPWRTRWKLMVTEGSLRRASYAAGAVMIGQQLCGINLLAFLAENFFRGSFFPSTVPPESENEKLLAFSMCFGVWNFVSTIPALFLIDNSNGRRTLLNWSFPGMAISLLVSALVLLSPSTKLTERQVSDTVKAFHILFLLLFTTAYSIGEGPAAFVISAEVFPLVNRELGMSLAVFWNFLGAGLLALLAPILTKALGQVGVLGLFSGTNVLAWLACFALVPPSTGKEDLEDVFRRFDVPTEFTLMYAAAALRNNLNKVMHRSFAVVGISWTRGSSRRKLESIEREWGDFKDTHSGRVGLRAVWHLLSQSEQQREIELSESGAEHEVKGLSETRSN